MVRYLSVGERFWDEEIGEYRAWGILAMKRTCYGLERVRFLSDISTDYLAVAGLVENCNKLQLSPIHLIDVVLDMLG